jgi:uncharacterized membrane protein YcaP (DUF421 family)
MIYKILSDILIAFIKSIVSIMALFFVTKFIGKKHIAQLTFFDYIVGIAIGSIAGSLSVDKSTNYANGLTALITWGMFSFVVAHLSIKSIWARCFFDSTPTIFIQNGKIIQENLKKEKININDFMEELRLKGAFNIADVEFAILETNGEVSVQLKSQKRPITPEDLNISTRYEGLSANLIIDGKIMKANLQLINHDEKWLADELSKRNIDSAKNVLLASLDTQGKLYIAMKEDNVYVKGVLE